MSTGKDEKVGGYWIQNNSMTRQIMPCDNGTREIVMESAAHADREGPKEKGLNSRVHGDLVWVPEGDQTMHKIAKAVPGIMKYDGPLEGRTLHTKLPGEFKARPHIDMTKEQVDQLPESQLTTPERAKRPAKAEDSKTSSKSKK